MITVNHLVTSGTFSLDGGTWDVDNNVWLLGDDAECVVIDAPHDADAILARAEADLDRASEEIAEVAAEMAGGAKPGPEVVQEVLDRLLELNHQRYAEEVRQGLHGKPKAKGRRKSAHAGAMSLEFDGV